MVDRGGSTVLRFHVLGPPASTAPMFFPPFANTGTIRTGTSGKRIPSAFTVSSADVRDAFSFPYGTTQQSNTLVLLHDAFQPLRYAFHLIPARPFQAKVRPSSAPLP